MGTFATNAQVYLGEQEPRAARAALIEAVVTRWTADGKLAVASEGEPAEYSIGIGPASAEPWIAVYDEATESQNGELLEKLARELSTATRAPVAGVLVHDSDVLALVLATGGRIRDRFLSNPDYGGGEMPPNDRQKYSGQPERWAKAFPWVSPEALREAWLPGDSMLAGVAALERTAGLLKWNQELVQSGFNHLEDLPGVTILRFKAGPNSPFASSPPAFALSSCGPNEVAIWEGQDDHFSISVNNTGKRSRGLDVYVWGSAIENGMVDVRSVEVDNGLEREGRTRITAKAEAAEWKSTNGDRLLIARFDDFPISAAGATALTGGKSGFDEAVYAAIRLHGNFPGESELYVGLSPRENAEGYLGYGIPVEVKPPPAGVPLRAPAGVHCYHATMLMQDPEVLFGLAIFDARPDDVMPAVLDACRQWLEVISCRRKGSYEVCASQAGVDSAFGKHILKFKANEGPSEGLLRALSSSKDFSALHKDLSTVLQFDAAPLALVTEEALPHLALSAKLTAFKPQAADVAQRSLESIMDSLASANAVAQAFVGKWKYPPGSGGTLYEAAHGPSADTEPRTGRRWVSRFLRAVTETMWLGPSLLARIDQTRLAHVAATERIGTGLKIALSPAHTMAELERALEAILPTQEDFANTPTGPR